MTIRPSSVYLALRLAMIGLLLGVAGVSAFWGGYRVGFNSGWSAREAKMQSHVNAVWDVLVVKRDGRHFTYLQANKEYDTVICSGPAMPNFLPGEVVSVRYVMNEQGNCWDIGDDELGYSWVRNPVTRKVITFEVP